jgi:DHA2 family multidrug resistance protein-like MFS transporter
LFTTANNSAILGAAPRTQQGAASAILAVSRNVGMTAGVALGGTMFVAFRASTGDDGQALVRTFLVAAGLGIIGAVFSWSRDARSPDPTA